MIEACPIDAVVGFHPPLQFIILCVWGLLGCTARPWGKS